MKEKLTNILKYFKLIYILYYYLFSIMINFLKIFVRPDNKLILFNSFAGRNFDDSPREIFDLMRKDERFKSYRLVWAFHDPTKFEVHGAKKIKTDTLKYFITALKARVWITNSSVERGLSFKGKNTFYFNTWHGTPIKLMGSDIVANNKSFKTKNKNQFDVMTSQGEYETEIYARTFGISKDKFFPCGLPRNDKLAKYTSEEREKIKQKLGISSGKKVILYAPTFREFEKDEGRGCVFIPPIHLKKWKKELGKEYVLLFRAHYEVARVMKIQNDGFVMDMTAYPSLNELMIVADILLSDYSSVFFDFSITGKPMLHFTYDYDKYARLRGMYFDIRDYISGGEREEEIFKILKEFNFEKESKKTYRFRDTYIKYYGNATKQSVDYIAKHIAVKTEA